MQSSCPNLPSEAVSGERFGLIDQWLQPVRDVADSRFECRECWSDGDLDRLCEASIAAQVERLARTPTIQEAWKAGKDASIHGWIYGLEDGLLSNLDCTVRGGRQSES